MIEKVDHIGIAVRSLQEQLPLYRDVLGLEFLGMETVEDQKVRVAMFQVGEVRLELLEPLDEESPIARFLQKKGEGLHHIGLQTNDLNQTLARLKKEHIQLIDEQPRNGAHQTKIAFLHPRSTGRVLMELCQPDR